MNLNNSARLSVVAFVLVAVAGVFLRPLTPIDETRYVDVAWEMYINGNYLVPTRNFDLYTHKPPLLFWTINLVWSVFGVSEAAARLVGPFYALVCVWLTGLLARQVWPNEAGIRARAVLVLTGLLIFSVLGGLTMFDAMLTVAVLIGMLALVGWVDTGERRWWVLLGVALALGGLAKGPVIFVHLGPALLLMPLWAKDNANAAYRQILLGLGVALAVGLALVALWVIPAILTGGQEYRDAILWHQTAGRISESFAHRRPWWFFVMLMPLFLFPWIWVPEVWRRAKVNRDADRGLRLLLIWFGGALVLFSLISGKQPHYLFPELPAFALIVAHLIGGDRKFRLILPTLPVFLVAALAVAGASGLLPLGELETLLTPKLTLLAWGLGLVALCLVCIWIGGLRGAAALSLGLTLSINLLIGFTDTRTIYDAIPIAERIKPFESKGIAFVGQDYNAEFNFAARFTTRVATPKTNAALQEWSRAHPEGVIVGRPDRADIPWAPHETVLLRNAPYAIWRVSDATNPEFKP